MGMGLSWRLGLEVEEHVLANRNARVA